MSSPERESCAREQERSEDGERVAEANKRWRSSASRDGALEDASSEPWQPRELVAVVIDDRRDAGVGRAQHRPRRLDRAHGCDLLVLLGRERTAIPGIVGDVDEQRRLGQRYDELAAECILVADIDRHAFACNFERRDRKSTRLNSIHVAISY